jgi:hypothetical protein
MELLASCKVNDAVKLAFLDGKQLDKIDKLDLKCLTEFRRHGNGAVELKLLDRTLTLEKLYAMLQDDSEDADAFFRALEGTREHES